MPLTHEQANVIDNRNPQDGIRGEPQEKLGFQRGLNLIVACVVGLFFAIAVIGIVCSVAYELIFG